MAITILNDRIKIGEYSLYEGYNGIYFDGTAAIKNTAITPVQASVSGYTSGGLNATPASDNTIDKFPFATNANATDVGDLTVQRYGGGGQSSTESGYTSGGVLQGDPQAVRNTIDKFPFATNANATDVGDLTATKYYTVGQSSFFSGYATGGTPTTNAIDKFPFATNANATDVGDLTLGRYGGGGQSSTESGYTSGGISPPSSPSIKNEIDKFPFATNANATDVGDLTIARTYCAGQSSTVDGYSSGGSPPFTNVIDKFSFASNGNATDVGDLTLNRFEVCGQSSSTTGYTSGGRNPIASPIITNTIDRFPFAVNANATDVGDLTVIRYASAGQQY